MNKFQKYLRVGQTGESIIARYFRSLDYAVMPVYEKILDTGKGPQLFTPVQSLIAPDMLVFRHKVVLWAEAKHKTVFSWYGKESRWVTGIDAHHYGHYLKVDKCSIWPVWLFFLHVSDETDKRDVEKWNAPKTCPTGLFGGSLEYLSREENISHTSPKWGKSGMVYWAHDTFKYHKTLQEVYEAIYGSSLSTAAD